MNLLLKSKRAFLILTSVILLALFFSSFLLASAQSSSDISRITFPIEELGGCGDKNECKTYCDDLDHVEECVAFAEKNGLISSEEAQRARKFSKTGNEGPGGCGGKNECEAYCDDINNIDECLAFAEESGVLDSQEIEEAKKVSRALKNGAKLPGGCQNKRECEAYCEAENNIDECVAFAEEAGFIPPEEIENVKKFTEFMKRGETPGGCKGRRECEAYCYNENNIDECTEFAIKAGFVSEKGAEHFRKTGGTGPGECRGKEECEAFCENPDNTEICINFAREHGLIDEGQLRQAEDGMREFRKVLNNAPQEVVECIKNNLGDKFVQDVENGRVSPGRDLAEKVQVCFEDFHKKDFERQDRRVFEDQEEDHRMGRYIHGQPDKDFERGEFMVNNLPKKVSDCVRSRAGGETSQNKMREIMESCFEDFGMEKNGNNFEGSGYSDDISEPRNFEGSHHDRRQQEQYSYPDQDDYIEEENYYDDRLEFSEEERRRFEEERARFEEKRYIESDQDREDYREEFHSQPPVEGGTREYREEYREEFYNQPPPEGYREEFDSQHSPKNHKDKPEFEDFDDSDNQIDQPTSYFKRKASPYNFRPENFGRQSASPFMFFVNR